MSIFDLLQRMTNNQQPSGPVNAPTPTAATVAAPTMQQTQQQDFNNAMLGRMGQLGMMLVAAGQRMTPRERATILAQAPQYMDGVQADMANAAQARLMATRAQQEQIDQARQAAIDAKLSDPKFLMGLGLKPEMAEALGPAGVRKLLENQALANTPDALLDRRFKEAQISHLLAPPAKSEPTPQLVDRPGGGKGWATPGSTEIIPIGGAGKGGVDPEMAKRTENEDKNLTYAKEAIVANRMLSLPQYSGELTNGWNKKLDMIPTINGSWAGENYLTGDRSANSFVDSVVRPRSGAVVGKEELENNRKIFTPSPGDDQNELIRKAKLRTQHIQSLIAGANPADRDMLQKMYDDSVLELQKMAADYQKNGQGAAPSMPKVKSITEITGR